jgi:hypothetical protein
VKSENMQHDVKADCSSAELTTVIVTTLFTDSEVSNRDDAYTEFERSGCEYYRS